MTTPLKAFEQTPAKAFNVTALGARGVTMANLPPLVGGCGLRAWDWATAYFVVRLSGFGTADYQLSNDGTKRIYYRTSHLNGTWTLYAIGQPGVWQPGQPNVGGGYYKFVGSFLEPDTTFGFWPYDLAIGCGCVSQPFPKPAVFQVSAGSGSFPGVNLAFQCPSSASPVGQSFTKVAGDFIQTHDQGLSSLIPGGSCEVLDFYPGDH